MICQSAWSSCSQATSSSSRSVWSRTSSGSDDTAASVFRDAYWWLGPLPPDRPLVDGGLAGWRIWRVSTGSRCMLPAWRCPPIGPSDDLTAELTRMLGDTDPETRGRHRVPHARHLGRPRRLRRPAVRARRRHGRRASASASARRDTDSVFRRSFSALVLGECIARDNERPLVAGGKVLEWGDRLATWLLRERDLRGFVPGKGWAHAVAHGADALGTLARSPHVARQRADRDPRRHRRPAPAAGRPLFTNGEPDRLAAATMEVLRRNRVPLKVVEPWIARIVDSASTEASYDDRDPHLAGGNAEAFLRALYLQLSLGPRPPEIRSDLLLVMVDALRTSNPPPSATELTETPHDQKTFRRPGTAASSRWRRLVRTASRPCSPSRARTSSRCTTAR